MSTLYPNLSKETAAHHDRLLHTPLDQTHDLPMPWLDFADMMEKQRDDARETAERVISQSKELQGQVLGCRETIKALEEKHGELIKSFNNNLEVTGKIQGQMMQLEEQLAAKDGYPADDGGPAFPMPDTELQDGWQGMTLRDWFAGMALQGLLASGHFTEAEEEPGGQAWMTRHEEKYDDESGEELKHPKYKFDFPEAAWRCSDAMLSVRNGKEGA